MRGVGCVPTLGVESSPLIDTVNLRCLCVRHRQRQWRLFNKKFVLVFLLYFFVVQKSTRKKKQFCVCNFVSKNHNFLVVDKLNPLKHFLRPVSSFICFKPKLSFTSDRNRLDANARGTMTYANCPILMYNALLWLFELEKVSDVVASFTRSLSFVHSFF